jgi:uncharacterized protein
MSKTRIIEAVKKLDLQTTKKLLDSKPELLNVTDPNNRNLLHLACSACCAKLGVPESVSVRMVDLLLDRGLDLESPLLIDNCDTVNALWFAVARGRNPTLVKLFIKLGANVNGLYAAGWWEDMEILEILVRAGATIDVSDGGDTPFLACWNWKKFEAAKFLALKGANVNFQDKKGKTALHHGVEKDFDPALLKWLVRLGASPDIKDHDGVTARVRASRKRDKRFLAALGTSS